MHVIPAYDPPICSNPSYPHPDEQRRYDDEISELREAGPSMREPPILDCLALQMHITDFLLLEDETGFTRGKTRDVRLRRKLRPSSI